MADKIDVWEGCIHDINNLFTCVQSDLDYLEHPPEVLSVDEMATLYRKINKTITSAATILLASYRTHTTHHDQERLVAIKMVHRIASWEEKKNGLGEIYNLKIFVTHDISQNCAGYLSPELARRAATKILENANKAGATKLHIHYQEEEKAIVITFADNGCGMSAHELHALGFAGHPTKGVPLLRKIINQAGGTVQWKSQKGVGTWVVITVRKVNPTDECEDCPNKDCPMHPKPQKLPDSAPTQGGV